jgi:radical SAM superfamily enzyme YgiQ (UPF0313 family)
MDAKADILLYGNAERAIVEVAQRLSAGEPIQAITDVRGTAFVRRDTPEGWFEIDSTRIDRPGRIDKIINSYREMTEYPRSLNYYAVDMSRFDRLSGFGSTRPLPGEQPDSARNQRIVMSLSMASRPSDARDHLPEPARPTNGSSTPAH